MDEIETKWLKRNDSIKVEEYSRNPIKKKILNAKTSVQTNFLSEAPHWIVSKTIFSYIYINA